MTRLLAAVLIVVMVAGCGQAAGTRATTDDPTNTGHTESGGAGGGAM